MCRATRRFGGCEREARVEGLGAFSVAAASAAGRARRCRPHASTVVDAHLGMRRRCCLRPPQTRWLLVLWTHYHILADGARQWWWAGPVDGLQWTDLGSRWVVTGAQRRVFPLLCDPAAPCANRPAAALLACLPCAAFHAAVPRTRDACFRSGGAWPREHQHLPLRPGSACAPAALWCRAALFCWFLLPRGVISLRTHARSAACVVVGPSARSWCTAEGVCAARCWERAEACTCPATS